MSYLEENYNRCIDDIISSLNEMSYFISKSSEHKAHIQRSSEIVNVTSATIKIPQVERQLVLQEIINSLTQLFNLSTCKKTIKLVLKCLDKLLVLTKIVNINTLSTNCIFNLIKKISMECDNDSELLLKLIQIILTLNSPNSLHFHVNNLFYQSFNLLCFIGKRADSPKINDVVTAALENSILQLVSIYTIKFDTSDDGNKFNHIFNQHKHEIDHPSECEIILHSLLNDFINLISNQDVLFIELSSPKAFEFILLITNHLNDKCIANDPFIQKILVNILLLIKCLDDDILISKYILAADNIFKILSSIPLDFITQIIDLCNESSKNIEIISLLLCLLASNFPKLTADDPICTKLLNFFLNKLSSMKYKISELSISSMDAHESSNSISDTCKNLSKLFQSGKFESCYLNESISTICLQGVISLIIKYHSSCITLDKCKNIFQILLLSENPTKLVYSSLNLLYSISVDKKYIIEFACNRALYEEESVYPLECVYNIFKQINICDKKLLEIPIRTLIRIIYNIVYSYSEEATLEVLEQLIGTSRFGEVIFQFVVAFGNHNLRGCIIKILQDCLKVENMFKKKFGTEIYLFLVKSGSVDDTIESLKLLNIKDDRVYHYVTTKYFDEINSQIENSNSTPLLPSEDWETLLKLHFSPFVIDTIIKCLDYKLEFLSLSDWNFIIQILEKSTVIEGDKDIENCYKIIQVLEQIVDNGEFDIDNSINYLFVTIGKCSKIFFQNINNDHSISNDNEGFKLVGIIWKIADLIGRDGITNNVHWWCMIDSLIQLSLKSSIAIKICSIRSLATTIITYWKLFEQSLPRFFLEWDKVIFYARENDELVDQESLFNVLVHETLEVLKVVDFERKFTIIDGFIDKISSKCDVFVFVDLIKYIDEHSEFNTNAINTFKKTLAYFIERSAMYVESRNSFGCIKISESSLQILKSKFALPCNDDIIILSLIYSVTSHYRFLFMSEFDKEEIWVIKDDYLALWLGYLDKLIISIKSDVTVEKNVKMMETLSNLSYYDASKYLITNYNSIIDTLSAGVLEKVLYKSNIYKTFCKNEIKEFAYTICSLGTHIPIESFNQILQIIARGFSSFCCLFIEKLVCIIQNMVYRDKDGWSDFILSFAMLLNIGIDRTNLYLFYIDKISQVIRCLIVAKQPCPVELLACIYSISSKTNEFNDEVITLHLVLINLLERLLSNLDEEEQSNKDETLDNRNRARFLYKILDLYADYSEVGYNITLRLFNDSQGPKPKYAAFVTLFLRLKKSLTDGNIEVINEILPLILNHKISKPELLGLYSPVFELLKPYCLVPCILPYLKIANNKHLDDMVTQVYLCAVDLIVNRLTAGLDLNNIEQEPL